MTDENISDHIGRNNNTMMPAIEGASMQKASLDTLVEDADPSKAETPDLDVVLDIPVTISMELGKTSISVRELLNLSKGSVVELDKMAGEPLDVYVNGTLIAHGEVVVLNEKFGIRLTDVLNQGDLLSQGSL